MRFRYKATTKDGKTVSGSVDAVNKQALIAQLTKQELNPVLVEIDKSKGKAGGGLFGPKKKIKLTICKSIV